jgi:predicted transcriptional regulator
VLKAFPTINANELKIQGVQEENRQWVFDIFHSNFSRNSSCDLFFLQEGKNYGSLSIRSEAELRRVGV